MSPVVNTGINPSLLKPQTFHVITYLLGNRALVALPQRMVMIGVQSAAATAIAGTVVEVDDPTQVDSFFGTGSPMSLMSRKGFETAAMLGQGPAFFAVPVAEGTTKATFTFTITGPATIDDQITVRIAGRYITTGIASGTNATNAAAAVAASINSFAAILPVTATSALGVVTITFNVKGTLGNDLITSVEHVPAGMTGVWAAGVAGVGAVDLQPALDAIAGQQFDAIAICNHQTADVTELNAQLATTWAPGEKKPRWFFIGEPGSIATATTLATAANHEGVEIINWQNSPSLPCEIATALATLALSKTRPNANYDGNKVPLYPPPIQYNYTGAQVETALNAGVTPLVAIVDPATKTVVDGVGKVTRLITSRTTLNGQPYSLTRDFGISRTAWAMAIQEDIAYARIQSQAGGDGMMEDQDTEDLIRDTVIDLHYAAQDLKWIKNVDNHLTQIIVTEDVLTNGRADVEQTYEIIVGLHQVAFVHRAQLG